MHELMQTAGVNALVKDQGYSVVVWLLPLMA